MKNDRDTLTPRVCANCVLPDTFPGIRFNEEGVCNVCQEFKSIETGEDKKAEYKNKFESLIEEHRGSSTYDVLVCYSGGKDSTQTVAILKENYNLNILAVSVDNGFVSNQATRNIIDVVEKLGVDHIFFKPRFDVMAQIFRHCAMNNIYSAKTLERASVICTTCMGIVKYSTLRMALEKNIPFVAYGWSPGQAPITSSIIKNNPGMVKMMQKAIYDPLYKIAGDEISPYFLQEQHFKGSYRFPYYIHPLAFLPYSEEAIYQNISRLGWKPPEDVDANSTNCLLNSFANVVHKQQFGFHSYAFEMANLVREGYLDRETALEKLNYQENPDIVDMVRKKLAIPEGTIID